MQEKEMVSDYLASLNASLAGYGGIIAQCQNPKLRQTLQSMRDQDESRQEQLFRAAYDKGYYIPAQQATREEIMKVNQQMSQG